MSDLAANSDEQEAMEIVLEHAKVQWASLSQEHISDASLRQILGLVYIQTLDFDDGGVNRSEAGTLLRTAVLSDSNQEESAWTELVATCGHLASTRSGIDRIGLHRELLKAGILPRACQSYASDIEKIKKYSRSTLASIEDLAEIRIGSQRIKIQRKATDVLQEATLKESLLVTGEPGAGKSATLHELYTRLTEQGNDVVLFAADRIDAATVGGLRDELRLDHELLETLLNWPGRETAVLIIDALDAARAESTAKVLREIVGSIARAKSRWHVVASIRKFDLRYDHGLRELFTSPGGNRVPSDYANAEFFGISHLNVPKLSAEELAQIAVQSPDLFSVISNAPAALHRLLESPFNVRLIADLLGAGMAANEIRPLESQLELLLRYWQRRVLGSDKQGDARESVLRKICTEMVEARRLRVNRFLVASDGVFLTQLLSAHVLAEWQIDEAKAERSLLVFSHHVLFDYAVARLMLSGEVSDTTRAFEEKPDLCIVVRPSLALYFHGLWQTDQRRFWELLLSFEKSSIPEFGKLVGPLTCIEFARNYADLKSLVDVLDSQVGLGRAFGRSLA